MEISSLLIGLFLLAIFIIPAWWLLKKQNTSDLIFKEKCFQTAKNLGFEIQEFDIWNDHFFIGLDKQQGVLFYINNDQPSQDHLEVIHLDKMYHATIESVSRQIKHNGEIKTIIDKLELKIKMDNGLSQKEIHLLFYDADISMSQNGESLLIKKWENTINNHFKLQIPA